MSIIYSKSTYITVILFLCMFVKFSPLFAGYSKRENELKKSFDLELEQYNKRKGATISSFGSSLPEQIERVEFRLIFDCPFTINEARDLLVRTVVKIQKNLNTNRKLTNQFREFPVKMDIVDVCYYSSVSCQRQIHDSTKAHLFFWDRKNHIYYLGYDYEKSDFFDLRKETFEEAYQIVFGEKMPD